MLSEGFIAAIHAQPKSAKTAVAKDVGVFVYELRPTPIQKCSFKKSSTQLNSLAASSTHIFAAQANKAVVHVYSRERGNQEALVSFPERIHCLSIIAETTLLLGTVEGRLILWEVRTLTITFDDQSTDLCRSVLADKSQPPPPISSRSHASLRPSRIYSQDPKTRISMCGQSLDCYL